jgi:sulfonate transport system ATP-binding protein
MFEPMDLAISGLAFDAPSETRHLGAPVSARGLAKSYGATRVLNGLDLQVAAGQFLAVVGRSGCGKSTLLRLIAGLEAVDAGRIAFADEQAARTLARVMFQEPRLLPWARVLANVEVGLGADRAKPDARRRALQALEAVGLADRADEWPSVLSGGQKQRVALARALVSRPRLLALDEPLGALDALTRIEMQRLLEQVWLTERFTAILVTHDVGEAIALADRIVLIEQGAIAIDVGVDLPRPRHRGDPKFGALEEQILGRLLGSNA